MSLCESCGASYKDSYQYCPHCGQVKTESKLTHIKIGSPYQEATLQIKCISKDESISYPTTWQPNLFHKLLGVKGKNWVKVDHLCFTLVSYPCTNTIENTIYSSTPFKAFYLAPTEVLAFPAPIANILLYKSEGKDWLDKFFFEREIAWNNFNKYLKDNSWEGLTPQAIERAAPFELKYDWPVNASALTIDGFLRVGKFKKLEQLGNDYRYRKLTSVI